MDKSTLRAEIRARLNTVSSTEKANRSAMIFDSLASLHDLCEAHCVAAYMPLADEPDSREFVERMASETRVVIPRVEGDDMEFFDYSPTCLKRGAFGIAEPQYGDAVDAAMIDVMIVPGRAFTRDGMRLGRGKGYYDRYMARNGFRATCIGVCFSEQLVDEIPCDSHDRRVDMVVCG